MYNKCWSTCEELYTQDWESLWDYDDPILGATYWEADAIPDTHEKILSWHTVYGILENLDNDLGCEHGDYFDDCYTDTTKEEVEELRQLILGWAEKHVKLRYYRVENVIKKTITEEDLC